MKDSISGTVEIETVAYGTGQVIASLGQTGLSIMLGSTVRSSSIGPEDTWSLVMDRELYGGVPLVEMDSRAQSCKCTIGHGFEFVGGAFCEVLNQRWNEDLLEGDESHWLIVRILSVRLECRFDLEKFHVSARNDSSDDVVGKWSAFGPSDAVQSIETLQSYIGSFLKG
jgi:hypothetical protein